MLRVLVTAPAEVRAARLASGRSISGDEASKVIADSDKQRSAYLKRFYDIPAELPTHYDFVVNTDRLSEARAAELIVAAAGA